MSRLLFEKEISLTPMQALALETCQQRNIQIHVKREDLCHPIVSGNKWHKFQQNLKAAKFQGYRQVLSFGGAWSNHIHALAYVCRIENLDFVAMIRGEELARKPLNPSLSDARSWGTQLQFISRADYAKKTQAAYLQSLEQAYGASYIVPEGGANALGVDGAELFGRVCLSQYYESFGQHPSHVLLASGSGTMAAGFLRACSKANESKAEDTALKESSLNVANNNQIILRVYPATHASTAKQVIESLAQVPLGEIQIADSHRLAFGKKDLVLENFIDQFQAEHNIPLDPVYHAKLFDCLLKDLESDHFPQGSRLLLIHSGGLQGARSLGPTIKPASKPASK